MENKIITKERWQQAQDVETKYWQNVRNNAVEFLRILHEKYLFVQNIAKYCPNAISPPNTNNGNALEIGIGSLGIGVISLLEPQGYWHITGVDPQPKIEPGNLPAPLLAFYFKLMEQKLSYLQIGAENLPFESNYFDLAACYNVLDHTHNPYAILKEIYRVLRPGVISF